jgi:hypothetical protein
LESLFEKRTAIVEWRLGKMLGPNAVQALTWLIIIDSPRGSVLFHAHSKRREESLEVVPTLCWESLPKMVKSNASYWISIWWWNFTTSDEEPRIWLLRFW